jgi:hypothetical protein
MKKYLSIILIILLCLSITACNTMTEEEKQAYIASHTYEYEVISVLHYMKPITNNFGGILRYESQYCFTYIDENGQLQEITDFYHTSHGLWKVCIGDKNKYVIQDSGIDTYKYLFLTKETLSSININIEQIK